MAAEEPVLPARLWVRALYVAAPLGMAVNRLIATVRLQQGETWAHYYQPPNAAFWCVVLVLALLPLWRPMTARALRAGLFLFAIVIWMILPTEAGSVHPDLFLEYEIQRVAEDIDELRRSKKLPRNPMELRKALMRELRFYYRRGQNPSVALDIIVAPKAQQPVLKAAERPGVIHVAVEAGGEERLWVSATGLAGNRFGAPAILGDPRGPIVATVQLPKDP